MKNLNFKHRIHFYEYGEVVENGWPVDDWGLIFSLWADIKTLKGHQYFNSASTQYKNYYRFVIRYNKDVHVRQQIEFEEVRYQIESVLNDDEAKSTMTIVAYSIE